VSEHLTLCVIPGDGVGAEVTPAAVRVLQRLLPSLEVTWAGAGWKVFEQQGEALPEETLELARAAKAVLFGAVASPSHPVQGYRSPIVALRRALAVYANLRPSLGWPVAGAHPGLDLWVVRENTEGLYAGRERLEGDAAITERVISRTGTERVARKAFALAAASGRKVTIVHKANVVRVGDGLWREVCLQVAGDFPDVQVEEGLVDSVAHNMIRQPGRYQLLLTPNLYGDILSDIGAALGGGLGMTASVSIGDTYAIAEPVHGAAPDIVGRGIANPIGAILSAALLVRHVWGLESAATAIEAAVSTALVSGKRTPDLVSAGEAAHSTDEMTEAVLAALDN
jgi:homoisocitrate dehydrogenase